MNTTTTTITHKEYMNDSSNLHHKYYLQFATEATKRFVLSSLEVKDIKKALDSGDEHLNDMKIPFNHMGSGGRWWWDNAPINLELARELGENNSPSTHTCVAKAMARELANA
jgi:hypothetical protein